MAGHDPGETLPDRPLSASGQEDGALREAEERYQALFGSLDCVYLHDLEGRFLDANPAALELLGYEREDIPSLNFASLLDGDQLAAVPGLLAELMEVGALKTASEFRLRRKTGDHVYVETKSTLISREGRPYAVLGIARDVTGRKATEASLLKAQFSLENVADAVHWIDRDGRIIDAGRSLCVRLGYSPEELLGKKVSEITVDESPETWAERWRLLKEEGPQTFEKQHRTKSGDVVPVEIRSSMVQYEGQEVVLAIARDITERKLAAEALRQSSEMFSLFLRDSPIYSYIKVVTPTESRVLHASANYRDMLGIPGSEMVGKSMEELFPEDRARRMHAGDLAVVSTGQTLRFEEEVEGRRFTTIKFPIARGDDILLAGYSIDVTEAREAEQALRASEQALKSYFDNAADAVFVLEIAGGRIRDCNTRACLDLGYSKEELLELSAADIEVRLAPAEIEAIHRDLTEGRAGVVEGLHRRKDGSVFPVEIRLNSLAPARPDLAVAVARDITERKRMEESVRRSEAELRAVLDATPFPVALVDPEDNVIDYWSQSALALFGHTASSAPEWYEIAYPDPEYRSEVIERWKSALERARFAGETVVNSGEYRVTCADGSERTCELYATFLPDRLVVTFNDITERKRAEESLRAAKEYAESLIRTANVLVVGLDLQGNVTVFNEEAERVTGYSRAELEGKDWFEVSVPRDRFPQVWEEFSHLREGGGIIRTFENPIITKSGERRVVTWQNSELRENGNVLGTISFGIDITERRRAEKELRESEDQLRQAQKMEAVGQLAGGIAHDFNNLLAAILGYCDLLLARPELADSSAREDLEEIKHAGERASALTRQILAFSRRQALDPTVVSVGEIVTGMVPLLGRTLGEDVQLVTRVDPAAGWVEADAHQFEQVIMNLALNARDAMPSGGRLTLKVADVDLSERFCRSHPGATPGGHVRLTVADAGSGMDEATRERAFEPFFTTKSRDKGTGLGLAMVYGTVKQSNGSVFIESRPGKGTKVMVYLPRVAPPVGKEDSPAAGPTASSGSETILLVEDEAAVRRFVSRVLESLGYRVLAAGTAAEALQLAKKAASGLQPRRPVDLLLTDVVLPGGMHGDALARELTAMQPGLPVLYVSGYPHDSIVHAGRLDEGVNFLEKPFTPQALTAMVSSLLERGGPADEVPQ